MHCIRKSQRYLHWHNNCVFRIFLRFRSGVSTRSLVFFLQFHSRNVTIFRIKVLEEKSKKSEKGKLEKKNRKRKNPKINNKKKKKSKKEKRVCLVVPDKMCVFCLYPIPDSQQYVKRGSCRRLILSGLLCLFLFWASGPLVTSFELGLEPRPFYFIKSSNRFCTSCLFFFISYLIVIYRYMSNCYLSCCSFIVFKFFFYYYYLT